jgi:hypothetical protein
MPKVIDGSIGPIGSIVSSMLTEAQYQGLYGTGWILMDGRSCVGSAYAAVSGATTVPDARGMVLRGKNNGRSDGSQNPDGDSALGAFQDHAFASHQHSYADGENTGGPNNTDSGGSISRYNVNNKSTGFTGGNETRMRNITVNHFIRIN